MIVLTKALEVETFRDHGIHPDVKMYRAVVFGVDRDGHRLVLEVAESDHLYLAIEAVLAIHRDVTHAKSGDRIEEAKAASVGEVARAMAGLR